MLHSPWLAAAVATTTAVHLLVAIVWSGRRRRADGYSHRRHTISELGEAGLRLARPVAWAGFAPVGMLTLATLAALRPALPRGPDVDQGLALLGLVGVGYLVAAVFPCDPGAPVAGSVRNGIHNLGGAAEYFGALGGLNVLAYALEDYTRFAALGAAARLAFGGVLIGFVGTMIPSPYRGVFQRLAEGAIFGWLVLAGWVVAMPA